MTAPTSPAQDAGAAAAAPFPDPARVAEAHAKLLQDSSIQWDFPQHVIERHPPPQWLVRIFEAIGSFIRWGGSGWVWLFWILVALITIVLLVVLVPGLRQWVLALVGRSGSGGEAEEPQWAPEAGVARRLLEEADQLAAQGRFEEAVHLILHRSIEDINRWRDDIVRPSLTSRDIGQAEALPHNARLVFRRIAELVERSLFAGNRLSAEDWQSARGDYARFALRAA